MTEQNPTRRVTKSGPKPGEQGYILLGAIILLAVFVIALAVAAPNMAKSIQRDRDVETMHRGKQYIRAIQLYYRRFHAYPPNVEALVKTNDIRFLRKKYIDPTTGKDDWKPILFGQNKTPMAMGFFGQPLGGTGGAVLAGTGPSGGNGLGGGAGIGGGIGSPIGAPAAGAGGQGDNGAASNSSSSSTDSSSNNNGSSLTFGGAGVIGVSPASTRQSIYVYKKMNHYNEWEFLYSPLSDQPGANGGTTIQPTSGTSIGGSNPLSPSAPSPAPAPQQQ